MAQPTQREFWNGAAGDQWVRRQETLDAMLEPMTAPTIATLGAVAGKSVLDVGCGSGETTMRLAKAAGLQGAALGVDISEPLIAFAKQRARDENSTARFIAGDAGADFLPDAPYDALFSRFGVMFFEDPVRALSHLRAQATPGGTLAFVCWRRLEENYWNALPAEAIMPLVPAMPPPPDPNAPGPAAFANQDRTRGLMRDAGWKDIAFNAWDGEITLAPTTDDAADFFVNMSGATRLIAAHNLDRGKAAALIKEKLKPLAGADGKVRATAACWIVTAKA